MDVICCVSFSNEYINFSSPPARRGSKQVGEVRLSGERQMSSRPCTPSRGPRTSSFITRSGTLTALDCLSQAFFPPVLCWWSNLSFFFFFLTRPEEAVIKWKAALLLPVWFGQAICLSVSIWGAVILAVFLQAKAHSSLLSACLHLSGIITGR